MPIELKITVNHATDLAAEVANLASIFGVGGEAPAAPAQKTSAPAATTTKAAEAPASGTAPAKAEGDKKTMTRKEQDEATAEMIKNGAKDDRFDLLTKGRQNEVEAALAKAAAPTEKEDADLDDMFSDSAPAAKTVTRDEVSALMAKIGKDKDGNPIQPRLLKIREILVDLIPEGEEIKVKNLPEDKLAEAFDKISKVEG